MRAIFGVLSLLLVLAVVGLVVKKQLAANQQAIPALAQPASAQAGGTVQQQSQQIQQQYKQAIDAATQQARPVPD